MNPRLENLKWLLVDLMLDLSSPAKIYRDYRNSPDFDPDKLTYIGIARVCNSHAILALCKMCEILKNYNNEIRDFPRLHKELNQVKANLEVRGINRLRSQYIAHIHEKGEKSPPPISEMRDILEIIARKDLDDFYEWISPVESNSSRGILNMVYELKEEIRAIVGSTSRENP